MSCNKKYKLFIINSLMFLIGVNFMSNAILFVYLLCGCLMIFYPSTKVSKNNMYLLGLYFSIAISIVIYSTDNIIYHLIKFFTFPLLYYCIYNLYRKLYLKYNDISYLIQIFFIQMFYFSMGNIFHIIVDMLSTDIDAMNMGNRVINDIWTGGTAPATIIVGWGCLAAPILLGAYERRKEHKQVFLTCLILESIYIIYSFEIATRLGLINSVIVFMMFVLLKIVQGDIKIELTTIVKFATVAIVLVLVSGKVWLFIKSSNLYLRLFKDSLSLLDSNGRLDASLFVIKHFSEALWGGEHFSHIYGLQQHNIIFQMYDLYGLVPFLFICMLTFKAIKNTYRIFKAENFTNADKRFLILVVVGLILYLFEEPTITSNFIISGMLFVYLAVTDVFYLKKCRKI